MTEILDTTERIEDETTVITRTEACRMCGYRRTLTEKGSRVSAGPWERFRLRVSF